MNKKTVNELIPEAKTALEKNVSKNGKIDKKFRGYISSFGAAISTGSLTAAVAFISGKSSGAEAERHLLPIVILDVIKSQNKTTKAKTLFDYIIESQDKKEYEIKEDVLNAAIAVKLALNLFELTDA